MPSGRPKNEVKKYRAVTLRLDEETHNTVTQLAKESFRSKSQYIEMLLINHIEDLKIKGHFQGQ